MAKATLARFAGPKNNQPPYTDLQSEGGFNGIKTKGKGGRPRLGSAKKVPVHLTLDADVVEGLERLVLTAPGNLSVSAAANDLLRVALGLEASDGR